MPQQPLKQAEIDRTLKVAKKHGYTGARRAWKAAAAARALGIPIGTLNSRLSRITKQGLESAEQKAARLQPVSALLDDLVERLKANPALTEQEFLRSTPVAQPMRYELIYKNWRNFRTAAWRKLPVEAKTRPDLVHAAVAKKPLAAQELAAALCIKESQVDAAVLRAIDAGYTLYQRAGRIGLDDKPSPKPYNPQLHLFESDADGWIRYGFVTDNHIGSKYARLDVLNALYDHFAAEGITRVYNAGNWIDGEARFNRHDLEPWAHGMEGQLAGFVKHYPQRPGITTYYVAGDDHEGWYDGIDIGLRAYQTAVDAGRNDLRYLGYMESYIRLRHKRHGKGSVMGVVHPGGGSAYAISYSPQKIVESYQGGEKPAVVNFGHYHKMDVFNYRNVWIIQGGTTQDQTPFMRKKRIEAHVGGVLVELKLDEKGAVTTCRTEQIRYFDRGYYNFQFDRANPVRRLEVPA